MTPVKFVSAYSVLDSPGRLDEEHRLIARYAARLAAEAGNTVSAKDAWCPAVPRVT